MKDKLEILFWKVARRIIINGYGKPCSDFDAGCACCRAGKTIEWIDHHINLIK